MKNVLIIFLRNKKIKIKNSRAQSLIIKENRNNQIFCNRKFLKRMMKSKNQIVKKIKLNKMHIFNKKMNIMMKMLVILKIIIMKILKNKNLRKRKLKKLMIQTLIKLILNK